MITYAHRDVGPFRIARLVYCEVCRTDAEGGHDGFKTLLQSILAQELRKAS